QCRILDGPGRVQRTHGLGAPTPNVCGTRITGPRMQPGPSAQMRAFATARKCPFPQTSPTSPPAATDTGLSARFRDFVDDASFPCVGAKAALSRDSIEV